MLALPGSYLSSLGALTDGLALVARQVLGQFAPPYRRAMKTQVRLLSPSGRSIEFAGGREMTCDGDLQGDALYRIVYVPAFLGGSEQALTTLLDHAQPVLDWLRHQHAHGAVLAGSGTAVLLLAECGLLDHGTAAVLKPLAPWFRRRYRRVSVDTRATLVEHQRIHTCSAPASEWALVARLVEQTISPQSAQWLASTTGMQAERRGASSSSDDPLVASAQFWLAQRFAQEFRITELARTLTVSHATLIRRFERSLGVTPRAYALQLRIDAGQRMLRSTQATIEQIATTVGYADVRSFRTAFRALTEQSPSAWRQAKAVP